MQLVREVNFDESKRTCVKGAVEILSQFCDGTTDEYDLLVTLARLNFTSMKEKGHQTKT